MYLSRFASLQPTYLVNQEDGLAWLGEAHSRATAGEVGAEKFATLLRRFGCGPDKIQRRGTFVRDFTHRDWEQMQIFSPRAGLIGLDERMAFFKEALLQPLDKLYQEESGDFAQWIHVTCTGYVSPSLIQTLASRRDWGGRIECLHAYHMGCYAAFPALRMARGNLTCEILHTEMCTLHLNPANHDPEQLVIQSLFADGAIKYRATAEKPPLGYEVLEAREIIAGGTLDQMTWDVSGLGFRMTLAREVPKHVQQGIVGLVKPWKSPRSVYAIHPGGPRIIDAVKDALELSEEQVYFSREVLRLHGNMSSATLPHVWKSMLTEIAPGTDVISMAFGPGLTLSANHMVKIGSNA